MKIKRIQWKKKYLLINLLILVISFLCGFFITSICTNNRQTYTSTFTYIGNDNLDFNQMIDEDFLNNVIINHPNYSFEDIKVHKMLKNNDFTISQSENNTYQIITKTKYYETSFISSSQKILNRSETFIKYALSDFCSLDNITFDNGKIGSLSKEFSSYLGGLIALISGEIIALILLIFIQPKKEDSIIDNQKIFGSPFHLQYWKLALKTLKNTKDIVTLAMLFSLLLISKLFHLPSGFGNLGIGISYLFLAIICMIYGPFIGFFVGCLSDIIGYFITQNAYAFNLGYTLQAGLACLVYGLCLYRTKITFGKVLLSRTIINLVLNVLYGSLLMVLIYYQNGKFSINEFANAYKIYAFYLVLPKNLVYLLPQSILLYCVIKVLAPILEKKKYLEESISQNISLF